MSAQRRGIAGALLLLLSLGVANALALPTFFAWDEPRHAAYALALAQGRIPDVRENIDPAPLHLAAIPGADRMAAATHPPLYYALVAAPLVAGSRLDRMDVAVRVVRILTLLLAAAGLLFVPRIISVLLPSRPDAAVLATALCASVPTFASLNALVYNDALCFLATSAFAWFLVLVLAEGGSRRRLLGLGVWAGLALATRFSAVLVVVPGLLAAGVAMAIRRRDAARRPGETIVDLALCCVPPVVLAGWFYALNVLRYGDPTATSALLDVLDRAPKGTLLAQLTNPMLWRILVDHAWIEFEGGVKLQGMARLAGQMLALAGLVGLVSLVRARWAERRRLLREPRMLALVTCLAAFAALVLAMFVFRSRNGGFHIRYYYPLLWVPALLMALGYLRYAERITTFVLLGGHLTLAWLCLDRYLARAAGAMPTEFGLTAGLRAGLAAPLAAVLSTALLGLYVLGAALVIDAVAALRPRAA